MRIIAGEWRGRKLSEPRGREVTRPTTDRVREACASMVDSALVGGIEAARVLDAFAGSGAMGMEMLSRGACFAAFFDIDRQAAGLVRKNLEFMGCAGARYRVTSGDVLAMSTRGRLFGAPFNLVILDPPYDFDPADVSAFVERLLPRAALPMTRWCSTSTPPPSPDSTPWALSRSATSAMAARRFSFFGVRLKSSKLVRVFNPFCLSH